MNHNWRVAKISLSSLPGQNYKVLSSEQIEIENEKLLSIQFKVQPACYCIYFDECIKVFALRQAVENGKSISTYVLQSGYARIPFKLSKNELSVLVTSDEGKLRVRRVDVKAKTLSEETHTEFNNTVLIDGVRAVSIPGCDWINIFGKDSEVKLKAKALSFHYEDLKMQDFILIKD